KIAALLVSLAALWAFAAYVTLQDGINLLNISTLDQKVGRPNDILITALQTERHLSMVYLGSRRTERESELRRARQETDKARDALAESVSGMQARFAASPTTEKLVADLLTMVGELDTTRAQIDAGSITRAEAARTYTDIIDAGFLIFGSMSQFEDDEIAAQGRTLVAMTSARDLLAQEDAFLSGVIAAGRFSAGEPQEFTKLVGARRVTYAGIAARLPAEDRELYDQLESSPAFRQLQAMEDQVIAEATAGQPVPVTVSDWQQVTSTALEELRELELLLTDRVVERATPAAIWTIVRLVLAGGLGLIAVIASIVMSITTARALVRQLERLRNAAHDLAEYRLPRVVERLQHGEKVDVAQEAPPLDFGSDEIGQVGQAFNRVQETAIRVAVEQAELRRSVRDVFLSLARRSQALLHRQLGLLDAMERRTTDAEELAELFRIDHLATRMRRNAENLIVLSGATAGRAWRRPVPMVDVLRGALAEVEDYTRVTVTPVGNVSLVGRAVGDVIHLLAELIENAVSFSPPQTAVRVGGSMVGNGFAIEIEDRGLGLTPEEREAANEQLRNPPEFKLTSTARLGLYVVGKLAERHGIRVRLTESPYGGTTAIVLLPSSLIADEVTDELSRLDATAFETRPARPAQPQVGRHRIDRATTAVQAGTALQASAETDLPLFNHVMRSELTSAVPSDATPPSGLPEVTGAGPQRVSPSLPTRPPLGGIGSEPLSSPDGGNGRAIDRVAPVGASADNGGRASAVPPGSDAAVTPEAGPAGRSDPPPLTPAGLPWRQRRNTAKSTSPLAGSSTPSPRAPAPPEQPPQRRATRGLEETRNLMASYRSGTLRGRSDAARLAQDNTQAPEWRPPTQESAGTEDGG
ncbi:MAG TPA: nitrate- and nitrite sensing domain-containing protein, partial [Micromonosporaceae bacterium]|nr:nitrate- and nitrite sensing domain-containing protein [Micromonosporaceae bacterium]